MNAAENQEQPIQLRSDLVFDAQNVGARGGYMCHDPDRGEYYRFGQREYQLSQHFDGKNLAAEVARLSEGTDYEADEAEVQCLALWLVQQRLTQHSGGIPSPAATVEQLAVQGLGKAISIRIPLLHADGIAHAANRSLGWLFSSIGLCVWLVLVVSGLAVVTTHWSKFFAESKQVFDPSAWIWLGGVWCVIKVFHEAGHALAAAKQGVRVGRGGIILMLLAPIAYVDVTDSWRLRNRWGRIQVAFGGVYVEMVIAALAVFVWSSTQSEAVSNLALNVILAAGPTTLLINANPLMRLDGYFALADLVGIPNLAMHGQKQLGGLAEWVFLGKKRPASMLSGWRRHFATLHATASIVYRAIWIVGLLLVVSTYFFGLGIVLAAIAFLLWVIVPFAKWVGKISQSDDSSRSLRRLAECGLIGLGLLAISMFVTSPVGQSVPVVVQHKDHQILRARESGFVRAIHVQPGQVVKKGELLLEIMNRDLEVELQAVTLDIKAAQIRTRQLRQQGKQGLGQAEAKRIAALTRRKAELASQLADQSITAPITGVILSPEVDHLMGTYAEAGDVLIEVGRSDHKELLASISQTQITNFQQAAARQQQSSVRLRGGQKLDVMIRKPNPRASTHLPHAALSALAGGSIAVETTADPQESQSDVQMTKPRFEAIIPIATDKTSNLPSGLRGVLSIHDQRTIFRLLCDRMHQFWVSATATLRDV